MKLQKFSKENCEIKLTSNELLTVYNSLNEVCYGMQIDEFETRIGASQQEASLLMKDLRAIIIQMDRLEPGETLKVAVQMDEKWLFCPNCTDGWESTSHDAIVICPRCEKALCNPRYKNE